MPESRLLSTLVYILLVKVIFLLVSLIVLPSSSQQLLLSLPAIFADSKYFFHSFVTHIYTSKYPIVSSSQSNGNLRLCITSKRYSDFSSWDVEIMQGIQVDIWEVTVSARGYYS